MTKLKEKQVSILVEYPNRTDIVTTYNQEEAESLLVAEQIKQTIKFNLSKDKYLLSQLIYIYISSLVQEDPSKIHFDNIREALKGKSDRIVDLTARSLIEFCEKLKSKAKKSELKKVITKFEKVIQRAKEQEFAELTGRAPLNFTITIEKYDTNFEKNGMFIFDYILLEIIKTTGPIGKQAAKRYATTRKKAYNNFLSDPLKYNPLNFWFKPIVFNKFCTLPENIAPRKHKSNKDTVESFIIKPEDQIHMSPAIQLLTCCIFKDIVEKKIEFIDKNVPALTRSVHEPIEIILSPKNNVEEVGKSKKTMKLLGENSSVLGIATIKKDIFQSVFNGIDKLNTVTGHKIIRFLPKMAFNQKISGHQDPRVLRFDGGIKEIAEHLGIKSNRFFKTIRDIFNAMAYFQFKVDPITGNLIQLSIESSRVTHRKEAYLITVGTWLLPHYTFEASRNNECGLLLPVVEDPPLVSPNQTHAQQYLLQMKIVGEFSKQSRTLAEYDSIKINKETWEKFAWECNIKTENLKKIIDRWSQDGIDKPKFLEKIDQDYYTLGEHHKKARLFLVEQGKIRTQRSLAGKKSANQKKYRKAQK